MKPADGAERARARAVARPPAGASPAGSHALAEAPATDKGLEALEAAAGRGRAHQQARALVDALVRSPREIARFEGDFGAFSAALSAARDAASGELRAVLDGYVTMLREIARGMGSMTRG